MPTCLLLIIHPICIYLHWFKEDTLLAKLSGQVLTTYLPWFWYKNTIKWHKIFWCSFLWLIATSPLNFCCQFSFCYEDWEGVVPRMWEETLNSFHGRTWYLKSFVSPLWWITEFLEPNPIFVFICKAKTKTPKKIYQLLKLKTILLVFVWWRKKSFYLKLVFYDCKNLYGLYATFLFTILLKMLMKLFYYKFC